MAESERVQRSRGGDARRDETEHERLDRNLEELTGELRVVVTGVQVLFAFLLIVVIAGLAFLALAMCGCLLLVTTKLFGARAGGLTAGLGSIPFLALWFAIPMRRAATLDREQRRGG